MKPRKRVRGGPQPRWPDPPGTEPAVRPPAQGVEDGRCDEKPSGDESDRLDETPAGTEHLVAGRRSGSEKLTGSPGGYSGPFPRFQGT